ncbi:unnamed protein product [Effrenium voratum]|uniref:Uncharacterized protein n=1 Tax=Effrenium voratum TaxID=2562239 RepID=A0AA36JDE1_9DINO|nr:unnamed protein product [Effrenium voratum]
MSAVSRRAAFDIGSGATKLMIADVVGSAIVKEHFAQEVPVAFAVDWKQSSDGNLSAGIQEKGLAVLRRLLEECARHEVPPGAKCAVATEVFRKANNGSAYLDLVLRELSLPVRAPRF